MQEIPSRRKQPGVIGSGRNDHPPVPEGILDGFRHIVPGQIGQGYLRAAFCFQDFCQFLRNRSRAAVNRSISDKNALRLNAIGTPSLIETEIGAELFAENRAMQRSDNFRSKRKDLFQKSLDRKAIFSADIEIITTGLASPVSVLFSKVAAL